MVGEAGVAYSPFKKDFDLTSTWEFQPVSEISIVYLHYGVRITAITDTIK